MRQNSQSQRILWLLEELGTPYQVKLYERQTKGKEAGRAPPALAKVHPLGKSPVLVTADGITIIESTTIATYLIKTYDTTGKFSGPAGDPNAWIRDDSLCSFAGSSLGTVGMIKLIMEIAETQAPMLARPIVRLVTGGVDKGFSGPGIMQDVQYLEDQFGDGDYFMGNGKWESSQS